MRRWQLGATMEVGGWLRSLGLGKYEAAFRENEINEKVLPSLTQEDLKEMGVGPVGHRRMLLEAIAALRAAATDTAPSAESSSTPSVSPEDRAERRQVTVMFSDLVSSTSLSTRMDPEDLRKIISAYQNCVAETVGRFGGVVAKYMGDGVLVYFGYPQAHEDDAERGVRAGLGTIAAVTALEMGVPLETRIGIATGVVVIGDLIGSGSAQEQAIVGETPNLAARLQGIAKPNTVVIAEGTRRLLGNLFDLKDLGPQDLKGINVKTRAWAALQASSMESRFEALHGRGLTKLVGRQEELDLLLRRWSKAKTGEGQVVLIAGEAGIGKSRLTAALSEHLAAEPHTRLRYFCSPQYTDSSLYPVIAQLERAAGLTPADTAQSKLDKLEALLARTATSEHDAALFAEMLSLPIDGRHPSLNLTPQQRRQQSLEALLKQLTVLAQQNPALMIFEDAHWTDPTSLELLGMVVKLIETSPVLLIVTFRPEFEPPWIGRPHVTALTINRLPQRNIAAMIDLIAGNKLLAADIRQDIIERTDGIPLFVEEMTKAVLEAGSEGEAELTAAGVPLPAAPVPASLHASLMARLDRLGPAKRVAQVGAAIGREFSQALLTAVIGRPEPEVNSALDRIVQSGLLFRQGVPPHSTYLFKHALVQDAAYGTLLREARRSLHARIAEVLENAFPEIATSRPELIARHCAEAGLIEKAARFWGLAAQRSLDRSALIEAVDQFTFALEQIAKLPTTPELRREEIKLQLALIQPLHHTKGYASREAIDAVERARTLIERSQEFGDSLADPLQLFSVLYGSFAANFMAFNGDVVLGLAEQFLRLAESQKMTGPIMIGHRLVGTIFTALGDFSEALKHLDRAVTLYEPVEHRPLAARFSQDGLVAALVFRSNTLWYLGRPEAAIADALQAIKYAREIRQAPTLMYALGSVSAPLNCGKFAWANSLIDELLPLADEKDARFWKAQGTVLKGLVLAQTGEVCAAVAKMETGLAARRVIGTTAILPRFLCGLASAYAEIGNIDEARRCATEAMKAMETTKERQWEAEACRVTGEISLRSPQPDLDAAQAHFERALKLARAQQAKSWELRAAMSMARLWRDQGKRDEARELLAPVYAWFTEGFDTRDLEEAKTLLDELGS
jgi:class 3 adenylate cyclase/predicted ATPase